MPKNPKALDLAGWRKSQLVVTKSGTRSMTQKELGARLGVGNSLICRIESGERWPSESIFDALYVAVRMDRLSWRRMSAAMARTWRAYSPDRKGKTP